MPDTSSVAVQVKESTLDKLDEQQCPFCVADTSMPWTDRMKV
jgi:hypothetical protein